MTDRADNPLDAMARSISPETLINAFLHDPPDKAAEIPGHQWRAARQITALLGEWISVDTIKGDAGLGDQLASIAERLPMPSAGQSGARAVGPERGRLRIHHPLGGAARDIEVPAVDTARMSEEIKALCCGIDDRRALFRLLWRSLPERMASVQPDYAWLPADTRVPDHTIWHHADTVTAFAAGVQATGHGGHALLSFALSPVQSFIAGARTLRDLRNGSLLLSWLAFRAMRPVLERIGPAALIFPSLRGNAMVDQWLRGDAGGLGSKITQPDQERLLSPSLPNTFLALVPMGPDGVWAHALARAVENAVHDAWAEVADSVRRALGAKLDAAFAGWDAGWGTQISQTWDAVASVLQLRDFSDEVLARYREKRTFSEAYPEAGKVRDLARAIPDRPGYAQDSAGRWQAQVETAGRMLAAARGVRRVPLTSSFDGPVPEKCTLLGTWERMGPAKRDDSINFWKGFAARVSIGPARVREGEALCAISLVKRFAVEGFLRDELELTGQNDTFPDTATVAARRWLDLPGAEKIRHLSLERDWNGQWLHWPRQDQRKPKQPPEPNTDDNFCPDCFWEAIETAKHAEQDGRRLLPPVPTYYAVLMLDGDSMGEWLAGQKSPPVRDAIHPKMADYFDKLPGAKAGLAARRPVSPSLHAAISEALGNFSQSVVPGLVSRHAGALVYAGGDDVLALLPTETVLVCARDLDRAFRGDPAGNGGAPSGYYRVDGRDLLMMGPRASVSAGIAVVHYKEDLRAALAMTRDAEKAAKTFGRNALSLTVARRSGEHAHAALGWNVVDDLSKAVDKFRTASDRWAYRMRELLPVFQVGGPPEDAFLAELGRQIARGEDKATRELRVVDFYKQLRAPHDPGAAKPPPNEDWWNTAERLITLWQSASFLARGRDVAGRT